MRVLHERSTCSPIRAVWLPRESSMKELALFVWLKGRERHAGEPVRVESRRGLPGSLLLVMVAAAGLAGLLV